MLPLPAPASGCGVLPSISVSCALGCQYINHSCRSSSMALRPINPSRRDILCPPSTRLYLCPTTVMVFTSVGPAMSSSPLDWRATHGHILPPANARARILPPQALLSPSQLIAYATGRPTLGPSIRNAMSLLRIYERRAWVRARTRARTQKTASPPSHTGRSFDARELQTPSVR